MRLYLSTYNGTDAERTKRLTFGTYTIARAPHARTTHATAARLDITGLAGYPRAGLSQSVRAGLPHGVQCFPCLPGKAQEIQALSTSSGWHAPSNLNLQPEACQSQLQREYCCTELNTV